MLAVGLLVVGFRPEAGVAGWVAAIGLLLLFSFVFFPTVGDRAPGAQPRLRTL